MITSYFCDFNSGDTKSDICLNNKLWYYECDHWSQKIQQLAQDLLRTHEYIKTIIILVSNGRLEMKS